MWIVVRNPILCRQIFMRMVRHKKPLSSLKMLKWRRGPGGCDSVVQWSLRQPGQFIMLRLADRNDPLIGRPLAVYDLHQDESGNWSDIDVLYLVKGNLTTRLVNAEPGQKLEVWGPLGNGFLPIETRHLIMVAGGIGQTPCLCLAREYLGLQKFGRECPPAQQVTFCWPCNSKYHSKLIYRSRLHLCNYIIMVVYMK